MLYKKVYDKRCAMKQKFWNKLLEVSFVDYIHVIFFVFAIPFAFVYKKRHKDLWLICENKMEARDNAYWLYRYIVQNAPEQEVVYAISSKSKDFNKVAELGKTVEFGSFKHWILYLAASKNISTQKCGKPNAAVCYFLEVYNLLKNTRVFLQHGVVKDDLPFLHYSNSKIAMFVTSTKRETEYVEAKFGYPKGYVKQLGLCRFDNLHNKSCVKKSILIMPTWRSWLSPPSNNDVKSEDIRKMKDSSYYKEWNRLLHDQEFLKLVDDNGLKVIFYQHREMQKFKDMFVSTRNDIVIASQEDYDVQELLIGSAYLITDYSSIAMDFAYMNKPLVYYQFDYNEFRKQHYEEGYFSYEEDGFGPVCYEFDSLMTVIKRNIANNFQNHPNYVKRHDDFFDLYDKNNCKRNYEAIKELEVKR